MGGLIKGVIVVMALLSLTSPALADLAFKWSAYDQDEADHFVLYRDTGEESVMEIPISATRIEITDTMDGDCHNYWLRAVNIVGMESENSEVVVVCPLIVNPPLPVKPISVGGFTITVTVTPD